MEGFRINKILAPKVFVMFLYVAALPRNSSRSAEYMRFSNIKANPLTFHSARNRVAPLENIEYLQNISKFKKREHTAVSIMTDSWNYALLKTRNAWLKPNAKNIFLATW